MKPCQKKRVVCSGGVEVTVWVRKGFAVDQEFQVRIGTFRPSSFQGY